MKYSYLQLLCVYFIKGSAFSPLTSIFPKVLNIVLFFISQKEVISSLIPGASFQNIPLWKHLLWQRFQLHLHLRSKPLRYQQGLCSLPPIQFLLRLEARFSGFPLLLVLCFPVHPTNLFVAVNLQKILFQIPSCGIFKPFSIRSWISPETSALLGVYSVLEMSICLPFNKKSKKYYILIKELLKELNTRNK